MKIIVKAKPNSKKSFVEKIDDNNYVVFIKEAPVKGKANAAIIKLLADYFNVKPYMVEIISGQFDKVKVVEVID